MTGCPGEGGIHGWAGRCLALTDPDAKVDASLECRVRWTAGELDLDGAAGLPPLLGPGRPARPELVAPRSLASRGLGTPEGRAAFFHAIAHIEFNAINLAWDAVYRYRGLPRAFYDDWVRVAAEEAGHFRLLRGHLRRLGADYGDFPAHDGLWEMAVKTAGDPLARMALVPRVLEARGLDVTPGMIRRLEEAGDAEGAGHLRVILEDEVTHVAAGSRWFAHLCRQRGLDPEPTFRRLVSDYMGAPLRGPFNRPAREAAGFTAGELDRLEAEGNGPRPRQAERG